LILDCCHAGTISKGVRLLESYGGRYYLMASVTPRDKALVDYADSRPLGVFSKFVLAGFGNSGARLAPTRNVSFKSLFSFANSMTRARSKQAPYSQDGGMAEDLFFRQSSEPRIVPGVRDVPKKSLYRKLFALGTYLSARAFGDVDQMYSFLKKTNPKEFLTPVKIDRRFVEYTLIGKETFLRYINACRRLGILKDDSLDLTPIGKRMFRKGGAQFNETLYNLLKEAWSRYSVTIADLEDVVAERLRRSSIPSGEALWFDMFFAKKLMMPKTLFTELLDLTGYVGALNIARAPTFFLAASADEAAAVDSSFDGSSQ
jgi:hypothetical protein